MLTFRDVTYATVPTNPQYTLDQSFGRDVFFSFSYGNSGYQLGCTIAAVSAQRPVEHVNNDLQNITTERTPQSVESYNTKKTHLGDGGVIVVLLHLVCVLHLPLELL